MRYLILLLALQWPLSEAAAAKSGKASWYKTGRVTASGEKFNPNGMTAAHMTLPFGTKLKVSYKGKSVIVKVNDRGNFHKYGRVLDLSHGAARKLGITKRGVATVHYKVL